MRLLLCLALLGGARVAFYLWGDDWVMLDTRWLPGRSPRSWENALAWVWPTS